MDWIGLENEGKKMQIGVFFSVCNKSYLDCVYQVQKNGEYLVQTLPTFYTEE